LLSKTEHLDKIQASLNDDEFAAYIFYLKKKELFIRNNKTGYFYSNYVDGSPYVKGYFVNGEERGAWTFYNSRGRVLDKYKWDKVRVGAICCDGIRSNATGRGACSWHGGVCNWLYRYTKIK
jgi:hypothetical protein